MYIYVEGEIWRVDQQSSAISFQNAEHYKIALEVVLLVQDSDMVPTLSDRLITQILTLPLMRATYSCTSQGYLINFAS